MASQTSRARIIEAATDALCADGLHALTLDDVARRAGCAKGLVNYHFGTKQHLLDLAADRVRADRAAARLEALDHPPAEALDRLWEVLVNEVASGRFRLWLGLVASPDTARAARHSDADRAAQARAAATALAIPASNPVLVSLTGVLDGFQLMLLQGGPEEEVREAYDLWWLGVLG
jgi:AcrR family transcriptional regulator